MQNFDRTLLNDFSKAHKRFAAMTDRFDRQRDKLYIGDVSFEFVHRMRPPPALFRVITKFVFKHRRDVNTEFLFLK